MAEPEVVPVGPDMVVSETLGGYDLLRRLGSGGMAEVHLARANGIEGFQKLVVLKQILPHLSRDEHFVKMFLEEARLAALLDHPNVVQVFDLGKEGDEYFFTMEFVYGENLQGLLKALHKVDQVLSVENVVTIGLGVAAGLHYAHERVGFDGRPLGLVHRDVSPTNVMITYEGGVKVADFGIAKVVTRTDVTRAGTRKGKVPYMSPEQCRAQKIDRRSDVFSLGIVLWEAITGERLFEGDNEFGVMNMIVHGQIKRPSTVRPDIPAGLEQIIMKALTPDKDKRYQSTRELQTDLETFACECRIRATPSALGELMHYLFRPQPFPWGALRGNSGRGQMSPATIAEISSMVGSQPSIPGTGVTSGLHSYGSQLHSGALATGASIGSMSSVSSRSRSSAPPPVDGRTKTLRAIAIGMGSAATLAAVLVLGLWLGGRGKQDIDPSADATAQADATTPPREAEPDAESKPDSELAAVADPSVDDLSAAADAVEDPSATPTEAEGAADAELAEAELAEGAEPAADPIGEDPGDEAVADADPQDAAESEAVDEDELIIEDDSPTKPKSSGRKSKPRTGKPRDSAAAPTKKKKPDLDAFMPGMGG